MSKAAVDLSLTRDPRESPVYSIPEVAHYLRIPQATLRSWVVGRYHLTRDGKKFFRPVIDQADKDNHLLSFMNLVEAHVLDAIRRLGQYQPCLFGRMAAKQGLLSFCILTESDFAKGDDHVREVIFRFPYLFCPDFMTCSGP